MSLVVPGTAERAQLRRDENGAVSIRSRTDAGAFFAAGFAHAQDDQLAGGPAWLGSKRFDLAATPEMPLGGDPKDMAPDQLLLFHKPVRLRLQRLLADRFQLELRRESAPMPVLYLLFQPRPWS